MMDMELENIVANTVYIKAREGISDVIKCDVIYMFYRFFFRRAQAKGQEQEVEGDDAIPAPGPVSRCSNWYGRFFHFFSKLRFLSLKLIFFWKFLIFFLKF